MSNKQQQQTNSLPQYGIPFRMDDYHKNRTPLIKQEPPVQLPPVKTARRQNVDAGSVNMTTQTAIKETKLMASDMAELIKRRLPADKLLTQVESHVSPPTVLNKQPSPESPITIINSPEKESELNNPSPNWKVAKCICCFICGCSVCTTVMGLCMALCYEWFGM